jgi:RNA recognition motif-containing protein
MSEGNDKTCAEKTGKDDDKDKVDFSTEMKGEQQQEEQKQSTSGKGNHRLTSSTIFVAGLAPALSRIHIEKLFSKFGKIDRLDIKTSKTGSRYCFVEFDSIENAQKALDNLNGRALLHMRLIVQPAHERSEGGQHHPNTSHSSSLLSSCHNNPARERKLLDRKIEELRNKIKKTSGN